MCGKDEARREVYKPKEEPESGDREKKKRIREVDKEGERERRKKKEKRRVITGNLERSQE